MSVRKIPRESGVKMSVYKIQVGLVILCFGYVVPRITSYMKICEFCGQSPSTPLPGCVVEKLIPHMKPINCQSIAEINGDTEQQLTVLPFVVLLPTPLYSTRVYTGEQHGRSQMAFTSRDVGARENVTHRYESQFDRCATCIELAHQNLTLNRLTL